MLNEFDRAFQDTVHECEGGPKKLAAKIRMSVGRLYNISNPEMPEHRPSVEAFRAILLNTDDMRSLDVIEKENGRAAFKLPDFSKVTDASLLENFSRLIKEIGDVGGRLTDAAKDGRIDRDEAKAIEKELFDVFGVGMELLTRVKGEAK